ncbi:hypothetical protein LNQ52_02975 [Klebsiella pneumoniae subsp. pneumoniae]|nr:hypothetical protein [Klebsiella pneumoniae subsp. pneumoniae]
MFSSLAGYKVRLICKRRHVALAKKCRDANVSALNPENSDFGSLLPSWQCGYFVLSRNKQYAQNRIIYCDASVAVRVICRAAQQQQPDNAGKQRI